MRITSNFVPDAPTLPAPNTPSAVPLEFGGNHAEHHEMPTVNELPASPKSAEQINNSAYVEAWASQYVGTALTSRSRIIMFRPPNRSAQMPKFSRKSEPERM